MPHETPIKADNAVFRHMLGSFATGVTVAACRTRDGAPSGITINSFTSLSLTPPLILFCLAHTAKCHADFLRAGQFSINILGADQELIARHFAGREAGDWSRIALMPETGGKPPLLRDCLGWMICRRHAVHAGGDHDIIVGEVLELSSVQNADPLLYFRGQYRQL